MDLARREDVERLLGSLERVDVLVSNAGLQYVSRLDDFPVDAWDRLLAVMLTTPFLLARGLLPGMYDAGWGPASSTSRRCTVSSPRRSKSA